LKRLLLLAALVLMPGTATAELRGDVQELLGSCKGSLDPTVLYCAGVMKGVSGVMHQIAQLDRAHPLAACANEPPSETPTLSGYPRRRARRARRLLDLLCGGCSQHAENAVDHGPRHPWLARRRLPLLARRHRHRHKPPRPRRAGAR
jgi:hypothetical protein